MQTYNFLSLSLWLTAITLFSNITPTATYNTYSSSPSSTPLTPTLPAAIPFSLLPTTYTPATPIAQFLNTLSLYPLAIDGKNFSALSLVFTENVIANYSPPIGMVSGLSNVMTVLQKSLAPVDTQHSYGTQVVIVEEDGEEGRARSMSYYTASQFGRERYYGEVLYSYGQYQDTWVKVSDDEWRIDTRNLVYMELLELAFAWQGPNIGNISVFTPQS